MSARYVQYGILMLSFLAISCSEREDRLLQPERPSSLATLRALASDDEFVRTELEPLHDDQQSPVDLTGSAFQGTPLKVFHLNKNVKRIETSFHAEHVSDTTAVVTIRRTTSGTLAIAASFDSSAQHADTLIQKPMQEVFERKVFFLKRVQHEQRKTEHEFEARGTISQLQKNCPSGIGSFVLVHNNQQTFILFNQETEFEHLTCDSLQNSLFIKVKARVKVTGPELGWLAEEIEREVEENDDNHEEWKKAAISLLGGGTVAKRARIVEMRVFFNSGDSVVVHSPLDFFFSFGREGKRVLPTVDRQSAVRVQVRVESAQSTPEVVLLRRKNVLAGNVSLKKKFRLVGDVGNGSVFNRTYEILMPWHEIAGKFHAVIEVWTSDSIYDDEAHISTHSWGLFYVVR